MAMKWLVLDALGEDGRGLGVIRSAVRDEAAAQGVELDYVDLAEKKFAPCKGCFGCWTKTPGLCLAKDGARSITARLVAAKQVIVLTPVVFGGYAGNLKILFERVVLPTLLPFFKQVSGRIRHEHRYETPPDFVAIGWAQKPDQPGAQIFAGVAARNAANMRCRRHGSCVVGGEDEAAYVRERVLGALRFGEERKPPKMKSLLVLTGSPKKNGSASAALGDYVGSLAAAAGAVVETVHLAAVSNDESAFIELAKRFDAADGVCLSYPLYADQLPGQVLEILVRLAAWRREIPPGKRQRLFAVANCGFPEASNNDASLEMCRLFAAETGFSWLGGCSLGGGGLYEGRGPAALGWLGRKARAALGRKTALLVAPEEPDLAETGTIEVPCPLPARVYLLLAHRGWKKALQAARTGLDGLARPDAPAA